MIDWILVVPVMLFIAFGMGYVIADKKQTKETWIDIFFD